MISSDKRGQKEMFWTTPLWPMHFIAYHYATVKIGQEEFDRVDEFANRLEKVGQG